MEAADRVAGWLGDRLTWLPAPYDELIGLPVLLLVAYIGLALLLRRLLPALLQRVAAPVVVLVIGAVGITAVTLEFLLSQGFRALGRRPPRTLYAAGDTAMASMIELQRSTREGARASRRLAGLHGLVLVAVLAFAFLWWNDGWCDRQPTTTSCRAPLSAWAQAWREAG